MKQIALLGLMLIFSTAYAQKIKTKAPAKTNVYGIDVSKYQGNLVDDIDSLNDLSFIICKATEGATYKDPDFTNNWKMIKEKKLKRGAYHFYHTDDDPLTQAKIFVETIGILSPTDIAPIIDIEQGSISGEVNAAKLHADLIVFLNYVQTATKRKPMIYTGLAFANSYLVNPAFANYHLWIAEYSGRSEPILPVTWKKKGYKIWQKSESYRIDSKTTDFDILNGNANTLSKL